MAGLDVQLHAEHNGGGENAGAAREHNRLHRRDSVQRSQTSRAYHSQIAEGSVQGNVLGISALRSNGAQVRRDDGAQ